MGYDDLAMFAAYATSIGFTISVFVSVRWGVGLELRDVPSFWAESAMQVCLSPAPQKHHVSSHKAGHLCWRDLLLLHHLPCQAIARVPVPAFRRRAPGVVLLRQRWSARGTGPSFCDYDSRDIGPVYSAREILDAEHCRTMHRYHSFLLL